MSKGSRIKGNSYERDVADLFDSNWNEKFRRVPLSGGWAKEKVTGDIIPVDRSADNFPFSIECKNRKTVSILDWIGQTEEDCPSNKIPLLAFHVTRGDDYACLRLDDFCKLVKSLIESSRQNPNGHDYRVQFGCKPFIVRKKREKKGKEKVEESNGQT